MIIHRDLKSLNLLLKGEIRSGKDEPQLKVSDFGLSRMKDQAPDSEWGKMTIAAATCHWMAPEVVAGDAYDEKVDVYSFGMQAQSCPWWAWASDLTLRRYPLIVLVHFVR